MNKSLKSQANRWRILPSISYTNWHNQPNVPRHLWKQWFKIKRYWSGKLIYIQVRHHQIVLDFRKNWIADFCNTDA